MFWFDIQLLSAPSTAVAASAAKTKVPQVETVGNDDATIDLHSDIGIPVILGKLELICDIYAV